MDLVILPTGVFLVMFGFAIIGALLLPFAVATTVVLGLTVCRSLLASRG